MQPWSTKNKRNSVQRAADMVFTEASILHGKTEVAIAKELSQTRPYTLTPQQIHYDVKKLEKIWQAELAANIDKHKARALAEIRDLQRTYWDAWVKSLEPAEITTTEKVESKGPRGNTTKAQLKKKGQYGDPRFLAGIEWCINKRCEILGLNAPKHVDFNWRVLLAESGIDPSMAFEKMVQSAFEQLGNNGNPEVKG